MNAMISRIRTIGLSLLVLAALFLSGCGDDASDLRGRINENRQSLSAMFAADRDGNIWIVDPDSGNSSLISTITYDSGVAGVISSMAYNRYTGRLFAGTGANNTCNACTVEIKIAAGTGTLLVDQKIVNAGYFGAAGMAFRSDGTMFGEFENENIALIDSATGAATHIGQVTAFPFSGCCGNGLTFDTSDTLYLANDAAVYAVNQSTAEPTSMGNLAFSNLADFQAIDPNFGTYGLGTSAPRMASMALHPTSGVVYGILYDGKSTTKKAYLVTVVPSTSTISLVGAINPDLDGLVFARL